jgi:hypothetical protein
MNQEISFRQGRMSKDPRTMNDAERANWQQACALHTRTYLFSIGQPLVYKRLDGHTVAEYADGAIVVLR